MNLIQSDGALVEVVIPKHVEFGIGTWFNRARFIAFKLGGGATHGSTLKLLKDRTWADKHYIQGTPEYKARLRMLAV